MMTLRRLTLLFGLWPVALCAADGIVTKTTHEKAYGPTRNAVQVDAAKDLPRYPAVNPPDAPGTWKVRMGFKLELVAHEPLVRDPIAVCFDERGRMFVCEMIDYSEMRDVKPHLGRISVLEDKDGDGFFETARVFADDLPWPTGLIWANGGLYVGATPDIWRLEDRDEDGRAEVRERVFTGFGTGLKILNVQGLMNSFQWGQDNRVHILAGGGNRGKVRCLLRPELPEVELGGRDFWFDPRTHEFGLEGGGAQYGMSFDDYGRKFACSNSDHLQYWLYQDGAGRGNPYQELPAARRSIAVDGGAAEVFRISPDEPWRIIRTRWRIAGVVKGTVEGGGRVSGYFTGATGTTIYRGDAYGPEYVGHSFTGDAGGQLIHHKVIRPAANGIDLEGERPEDERGFEFAASVDTWVRVVNFANAPDGCLYVCDMYREVIEHPWSVPDEIKQHLDLNSGNDRGRIWRIVPEKGPRGKAGAYRTRPGLDKASAEELVATLGHANGWHRDTAARLLYEKQAKAVVPMLEAQVREEKAPVATLHRLSALKGMGALMPETVQAALRHENAQVQERAVREAVALVGTGTLTGPLWQSLKEMCVAPEARVGFQLALSLGQRSEPEVVTALASLPVRDDWTRAALLVSRPELAYPLYQQRREKKGATEQALLLGLIRTMGAQKVKAEVAALMGEFSAEVPAPTASIRALAEGLKRAGTTLSAVDVEGRLKGVFEQARRMLADAQAPEAARLEALELVALSPAEEAISALRLCLTAEQTEAVQKAAIERLAGFDRPEVTQALVAGWAGYQTAARATVLTALVSRDERALALLAAVEQGVAGPKAVDLTASQVQALAQHQSPQVAERARKVLAAVIPPSRAEVAAKFKPALTDKGDAVAGEQVFLSRCLACHVANGQGIEVGPNLVTVKTKGREGLLTAILEPHKEVASQYIAYTVNTKDGQTLSGIIAQDDAHSMTLKMMGGAAVTVARAQIQGSSSSGQSLMPEGLEQGMSVQDMADLLSFIEAVK